MNNQIIPCIQKTEKQIEAFKLLKSGFYENDNISNDSIRQLFFQNLAQWDLVLNTVAFDNLQSTGMDIISNDSIKTKLLTIYGNNYKYVNELSAIYDQTHNDRVTKLLLRNKVDMLDSLSNEDKRILKQDEELFHGMKLEAFYGLGKYLTELENIKPMSEELKADLKTEIQRLRKK